MRFGKLAMSIWALTFVMATTACSVKVKGSGGGEDPKPTAQPTQDLTIGENSSDTRYNEFEANDPSIDVWEKVFYTTPVDDMLVQMGGWGLVTDSSCNQGQVQVTFALEQYDAVNQVVTSTPIDLLSPAFALQKATKYGVRAKMTGLQGCRSAFLSFTMFKP